MGGKTSWFTIQKNKTSRPTWFLDIHAVKFWIIWNARWRSPMSSTSFVRPSLTKVLCVFDFYYRWPRYQDIVWLEMTMHYHNNTFGLNNYKLLLNENGLDLGSFFLLCISYCLGFYKWIQWQKIPWRFLRVGYDFGYAACKEEMEKMHWPLFSYIFPLSLIIFGVTCAFRSPSRMRDFIFKVKTNSWL